MSDSSKPVSTSDDSSPRYRKAQTRKRIALAKYYGMDGEEWTVQEIADHLRVSKSTVEDYIYSSDMAAEVEEALVQKEAQARMDIILDLKERFEKLKEIEEELLEAKDVVATEHELHTVRGEVSFGQVDGVKPPSEQTMANEVTIEVPVASDFKEVTDVDELQKVWDEMREVQEQMEDLLGLEEPEEKQVEQTTTERTEKIYRFEGVDDSLPEQEQEVIEVESEVVEDEAEKDYPETGKSE